MSPQSKDETTDGKLLLLATEQNVHAFALSETFRIALGRHDSNDIELRSRSVSNFHAEIMKEGEGLVLRDLRSTNGTFVNDERVRQRPLKSGDSIRIGNHVVTVHIKPVDGREDGFVRYRRNPESFGVGTRGHIISLRAGSTQAVTTIRVRDPHDVTLADLLKILTTNAQSVVVHIRKDGEEGQIFIRRDRIVHAEYGTAMAEKALFRMFGWREAQYQVMEFPEAPSMTSSIDLPADTLIMEGMQQVDELQRLFNQLPPPDAQLRLKEDCPLPITAHTSAEIEIFQELIRCRTIHTLLEETAMPDVRALRLVHSLIRKQVFEVADESGALLEQTFVFRRTE
jgi:sulfur carrier protein ThiS